MLKSRILFILPNLSAGGAERNVLSLVRQFALDIEVHLALIRFSGELFSELPKDVRLHDLHGRLQFPFRLTALIRRLNPCVVFSTIVDVNLVVLAMKRFFPKTTRVVIRDAAMPLDLFRGRSFAFLLRHVYRSAYANADAVITLTERCRRDTIRELSVSEDNVFLIRNAMTTDRLGPRLPRACRVKRETINIVSIGRLERQKAYDLLVRSLPCVLQVYPNTRLTIYGEGRERSRLQREIDRLHLGQIVALPGYVPNPIDSLRGADLFVLCSRYEGMSNAMIEALCCGTPVLATNNRENSAGEFVWEGVNGFLAGDCTIKEITKGLVRALGEYHKLDRERIQRDARNRFSRAQNSQSYRELIERFCEQELAKG